MGKAEDVALLYLHTFTARQDAFLEWHGDHTHPSEDEPDPIPHAHWEARRAPLTVQRVIAGLSDKAQTLSGYLEGTDGWTHIGAIDFDREDGWAQGAKVARTLADLGAFPYLERSRRGCHLWMVAASRVEAETMRLAVRHAVYMTDQYLTHDKQVEILPKKVERREDTLGSACRLPMMASPKNGQRYSLCDWNGELLAQSYGDVLLRMEWTPVAVLEGLAANAKLPPADMRLPEWMRKLPQEGGDVIELLSSAGVPNAAPNRTVRCPLHDDRMASLSISRDGQRVWCKSPACAAYNDGRGLGAGQLATALGASRAAQ